MENLLVSTTLQGHSAIPDILPQPMAMKLKFTPSMINKADLYPQSSDKPEVKSRSNLVNRNLSEEESRYSSAKTSSKNKVKYSFRRRDQTEYRQEPRVEGFVEPEEKRIYQPFREEPAHFETRVV